MDLFFVYSLIQIFSVSISAKDLYVYLCGYICVCVIKELKKKQNSVGQLLLFCWEIILLSMYLDTG